MPVNIEPNAIDLYALDEDWTDEQKMICEQLRRFVDREVLPEIAEWSETATVPREIIGKLAEFGILEIYASGDMDPTTYGLVMREIERGGSGLRSFFSVQGSLVLYPIMTFASDEQRERWLKPLSTFEKIGCFGLTEPDFGSNPGGLRTRAERTSDGFRLNGTKAWITNGTLADVAIIWAKLDDKINGFLVETDRKGFEARAMKGKWSFRTSDTAELFLDDVEIPEANLMPGANSLGKAMDTLNQARYSILWGVIGAARGCLEETWQYLLDRPQFAGKPLASHQLIQSKLAWMAAELTCMEVLAKRLGELKSQGRLKPVQVSIAKMNNVRKALEIARTCRELLGANGIHYEYHVGRRMLDLETVVTYEGTEHIHSLIVGHHMTGIAAYA